MTTAVARSSSDDILAAVQARIVLVTGLPADRVKLVVRRGRRQPIPLFNAEIDVLLDLGGFSHDPGHRDRHDCRVTRELIATVRTRAARDEGDRDEFAMTNPDQGNIPWEEAVIDALQNYWPQDDSGNKLTSSAVLVLSGTSRQKVQGDLDWTEVELKFGLPVRLPLTRRGDVA